MAINIEVVEKKKNTQLGEVGVQNMVSLAERLTNFLREFNIDLSIRLLNTLVRVQEPALHLINVALITGRDHRALATKCESAEWKMIEEELKKVETEVKINKRFILFFGAPGTGKTTRAIHMVPEVVVMHENITPKELLFDFDFVEGKPVFKKNALALAMEKGTGIVLDEINLAPFETIRFLQGILDNKETLTVGNITFQIKDGFHVIGTMNEEVLNMEHYLPEPLIDRAMEVKKFILTPEMLAKIAILGEEVDYSVI